MRSTSTTATKTLASTTPLSQWTIDFGDALVFDTSQVPIQTITYSFTLAGGAFARTAARPANGTVVTIETDVAVAGSVVVTVDQSVRS